VSTAICAEHVSKSYRLGVIGARTLRDDAIRLWARLRHKPDPLLKVGQGEGERSKSDRIWALQDVSFEIGRGEVIGIIGRNGAGKSTLLKILSRITAPTSGQVKLRGRVASLLEVGTGFHPELTGLENIYLNAAVLGMTRRETTRRLDEIIGFSGVERFIDTPVKRYSSGMYVRLAFAVAAHLDPDILLVDEVLAVGDAAFQEKCLGRMRQVGDQGRTVIMVSHNMHAISRLCERVIWLESGTIKEAGARPSGAIRAYLKGASPETLRWTPAERGLGGFQYEEVQLSFPGSERGRAEVPPDVPLTILFRYRVQRGFPSGRLALRMDNEDGVVVFASSNTDGTSAKHRPWTEAFGLETCVVPSHFLAPGRYFLTVSEPTEAGGDIIHEHVLAFRVSEANSLTAIDGRRGVLAPLLTWTRSRG